MLMDIIVIIILFGIGYVIVDTITAIKNARHKSNLPEVAKKRFGNKEDHQLFEKRIYRKS